MEPTRETSSDDKRVKKPMQIFNNANDDGTKQDINFAGRKVCSFTWKNCRREIYYFLVFSSSCPKGLS